MDVKKIKLLMKQRKVSQREISKLIGITQAGLSFMFKSKDFKVSTLEKIAEVLQVPVSSFFEDTDKKIVINEKRCFTEFVNDVLTEYYKNPIALQYHICLQKIFDFAPSRLAQFDYAVKNNIKQIKISVIKSE